MLPGRPIFTLRSLLPEPPPEGEFSAPPVTALRTDAAGLNPRAIAAGGENVRATALSPDGAWLAAACEGAAALHVEDLRSDGWVAAARLDSRRLAIGTGSTGAGTLNFRDFQSTEAAITIRTPRAIHTIVWHPDGRLLTGGGGPAVFVWETDPAKLIRMARSAAGRGLTAVERARHGL